MKDRVPRYPGRVKMTPVAGQANTYDMVRADQPTEEGTPLNMANLLSNDTAGMLGLGEDATPNDAFEQLMLLLTTKAPVRITVKSPKGLPVSSATVNGAETLKGGPVITDESGQAIGFVDKGSVTLSVASQYADWQGGSVTLNVDGSTLATANIVISTYPDNYRAFTVSQEIIFSPDVDTVDVCCVGGGGGGGGALGGVLPPMGYRQSGGGGGGGGSVVNKSGVKVTPGQKYTVTIGAGGNAGKSVNRESGSYINPTAGGAGGASSALGVTAPGGSGGGACSDTPGMYTVRGVGGSGNGAGGSGYGVPDSSSYADEQATSGVAGSLYEFGSTSRQRFGGGGGGGSNLSGATGGAPGGGRGAAASSSDGQAGTAPGGGGGGGGAGGQSPSIFSRQPGAGAAGQVSIRWRHKV